MNKTNKRQIAQIAISVAGLVLIIAWLCMPGWEAGKILGIIPAILIILSMVFSFIAEEKRKRQYIEDFHTDCHNLALFIKNFA